MNAELCKYKASMKMYHPIVHKGKANIAIGCHMVYLSDVHMMIYNLKTKKLDNYKNTINNPRIYKKVGFALTNFAERYLFVSGGEQTIQF